MSKYRVILAYQNFRVGDVVDPGWWKDHLLQRKYIELIPDEEPELETAAADGIYLASEGGVARPLEHAALRTDAPAPRRRGGGRPKGSKNKPKPGA